MNLLYVHYKTQFQEEKVEEILGSFPLSIFKKMS